MNILWLLCHLSPNGFYKSHALVSPTPNNVAFPISLMFLLCLGYQSPCKASAHWVGEESCHA